MPLSRHGPRPDLAAAARSLAGRPLGEFRARPVRWWWCSRDQNHLRVHAAQLLDKLRRILRIERRYADPERRPLEQYLAKFTLSAGL